MREKYDGVLRTPMTVSLRLWLRMLSCTTTIDKHLRRKFSEHFDTTLPRFDVLAALAHRDSVTMSELSREILVSKGNITGIVHHLQQQRLVDVCPAPRDRRTLIVSQTADGRRHFAELATAYQQWIGEYFHGISDADQRALFELLAKVITSIEAADMDE